MLNFPANEIQYTKIFTKPYFSSTFLSDRCSKIWRWLDQDYSCSESALQQTGNIAYDSLLAFVFLFLLRKNGKTNALPIFFGCPDIFWSMKNEWFLAVELKFKLLFLKWKQSLKWYWNCSFCVFVDFIKSKRCPESEKQLYKMMPGINYFYFLYAKNEWFCLSDSKLWVLPRKWKNSSMKWYLKRLDFHLLFAEN